MLSPALSLFHFWGRVTRSPLVTLTGKGTEVLDDNVPLHHESCITLPGFEPGPPNCKVGNQMLEVLETLFHSSVSRTMFIFWCQHNLRTDMKYHTGLRFIFWPTSGVMTDLLFPYFGQCLHVNAFCVSVACTLVQCPRLFLVAMLICSLMFLLFLWMWSYASGRCSCREGARGTGAVRYASVMAQPIA
jgi:hypothetical protein